MFVIVLTYKRPLTEVDNHGRGHITFLDKYFEQQKFMISGRLNPRTGGIILAANVTRAELDAIIKEDPFYTNGVADYEIKEFTPVKYQDSFAAFVTG